MNINRKENMQECILPEPAMGVIEEVFHIAREAVFDISVLKKGMTNRSFLFTVRGNRYIFRIPGEGSDQLINRVQEAEVFRTIKGHGLCDDPVYFNPETGYKITKFLPGVRTCNPDNDRDLIMCMEKLHQFHNMRLSVGHSFDLFAHIEYYEHLKGSMPSRYIDYAKTKEKVWSLRPFIDGVEKDWSLAHIDAVSDNFLFFQTKNGEALQLTDWEYAGMQDPHVDIAMFCLYSFHTKHQVDRLIDIYFDYKCNTQMRAKIYAYIAIGGLLWSNWCEFKTIHGVEFGSYAIRQYQLAKEYYSYAIKELGK